LIKLLPCDLENKGRRAWPGSMEKEKKKMEMSKRREEMVEERG
jgi:hypothetical protein